MSKLLSLSKSYVNRLVRVGLMQCGPPLVTQREFRKAHALALAAKFDPDKLGLMIVNFRDGFYWVIDGQHRLAALRIWDPTIDNTNIDCRVYTDLTDPEMAEVFLAIDERKPVPTFDKFFVAVTAGHKRENDVKRTVEANGQKIARKRTEGISTVQSLLTVYDKSGADVLGKVIRTLANAFTDDPYAFDRTIVEGIGQLYGRFNGQTNERALSTRLHGLRQGARELIRKANAIKDRTGNHTTSCVAAVAVEVYNKGEGARSKNRLPKWWKGIDQIDIDA